MKLKMGTHTVIYSTATPVLLSLNGDPVRYIAQGSGKFTLRNCEGELAFDPPKSKIKYSVETRKSRTEQTDDIPPPQPAPPQNYLQALREKVRHSMGITREAFAEHNSIYEVIDNIDEFEEDRVRQADSETSDESAATTDEVASSTPTSELPTEGKASD